LNGILVVVALEPADDDSFSLGFVSGSRSASQCTNVPTSEAELNFIATACLMRAKRSVQVSERSFLAGWLAFVFRRDSFRERGEQ
jgi:hypothetical protein